MKPGMFSHGWLWHGLEARPLLKVAFWLAALAWALVVLLAPRAAAGSTPVIAPIEAPRLVWPAPEAWRPHFYD